MTRCCAPTPRAFWAQPRVIASIAAARRREHADLLARHSYDVVVVDEAHHLRDQASASYRLVNSLQKRFLLLLSATPVQNSLLELYNLLTLLQPGIFKTQKEFRAAYMTPGKPREPVNRERLRDLMRGVMVRNTRALAALRLPRRHAATHPRDPGCGGGGLLPGADRAGPRRPPLAVQARLAVQHLLAAAGSSPAAAAACVAPLRRAPSRGAGLAAAAGALPRHCRRRQGGTRCCSCWRRTRPKRRWCSSIIATAWRTSPSCCAGRDGAAAVRRQHVGAGEGRGGGGVPRRRPLLLCSESGGEGRNLQFCNTLINFDIPWNPMAIEQRIGRIDRIGQTREVFVFNLVTSGTIEDAVLRILDEKINMFELVVGEVGAILGEIDDQQDFSSMVLDAWLQGTEEARAAAFAALEAQLLAARRDYEGQAARRGAVRERPRCRLRKAACTASSPTLLRRGGAWSSRSNPTAWRCWRRHAAAGAGRCANSAGWASADAARRRPAGRDRERLARAVRAGSWASAAAGTGR